MFLIFFFSKCKQAEANKIKIASQKQELEKRLSELKAVLSTTGVHKQQLSDTVEKLDNTVGQKEQYYNNLKQKLSKLLNLKWFSFKFEITQEM